VRRALASALQRAGDFGVDHLALPPFGLGAGNLAIEESADVMLGVIRDHLASGRAPRRVTVVVERDEEADAFTVHLSKGA
jgi:O-acetyl-ADP-ribose deacetylase (regulator of RNase III)